MSGPTKRTWTNADGSQGVAWRIGFMDDTGVWRRKQFVRQKDAQAHLDRVARQKFDGIYCYAAERITFGQVLDDYLADIDLRIQARQLEPSTVDRYRSVAENHVRPRWGKVRLDKVTSADVRKWADQLLEQYAPRHVKNIVVCVTQVLKFARQRGKVGRNVLRDDPVTISLTKVEKKDRSRPDYFASMAQVGALFAAAASEHRPPERASGHALRCASTYLALYTAMRRGECLGLHWEDVHFDGEFKGWIFVRWSLDYSTMRMHKRGQLEQPDGAVAGLKLPKNDERRWIPMTPELMAALERYEDFCCKRRGLSPHVTATGLVLQTATGRPLVPTEISNPEGYWRCTCRRAEELTGVPMLHPDGRPLVHFHMTRHLAASLMLRRMNPPAVASITGHLDVRVLLATYAHLFPEDHNRIRGDVIQAWSEFRPQPVEHEPPAPTPHPLLRVVA